MCHPTRRPTLARMRRQTQRSSSWWRRALLAALVAGSAACEQPSAPASVTLDTSATLADYQALQELFDSEGFAGVKSLGGRTPVSAALAVVTARALPAIAGPHAQRSGRQFAVDLFRAANALSAAPVGTSFARTIISDRHLGRTLAYDAALDRYVIDPTRSGAPANGVRFVLYETDASGTPLPAREIGRADLLDEGANTGPAIALRLLVVTRGTTRLDYRTRVEAASDTGAIDVSGFAADGSERLDFHLELRGRSSGGVTTVDADFDLSLQRRAFSVAGQVRGVQDGRDGEGSVAFSARHQANTLRLELLGENGRLDGRIIWNGTPYISISGPANDPVLRGPTGQPLTAAELLVVHSVMRLSDDIFDLVEELVEPVQDLVLLGWLL